ncbi:MAG TPA: hypothetical protein VGR56_02385 [Nitrososphaerales archaeon]|nr:hypothetical protein [Nitrososphaerales archaeon]
MKNGTHRGIGIEKQSLRDWRFSLGLVGIAQLFVVLWGGAYAADNLKALTVSEYLFMLEASIVITIASFVVLGWVRFTQGGLGTYALEWSDIPSTGEIRMSYTTPKGKQRLGLVVGGVKALPDKPLFMNARSRYQAMVKVEGTEASVIIDFKNQTRFSLGLGFPNAKEMNQFYEQTVKVMRSE